MYYAEDGNLNEGQHKNFRLWRKAGEFAIAQAEKMRAELTIHPYGNNTRTIIKDYSKLSEKQSALFRKSALPQPTRKRGKITHR